MTKDCTEKYRINFTTFIPHLQVILARNTETGEVVAIKKISIRNTSKPGLPDNVLREIKSLELVSHHPNIVRLIDVFPKVSQRLHEAV